MAWGMKNITFCLYGSSIMEGRIGVDDPLDRWYNIFQRLLTQAYPDTCFSIVNSAVGGESTREIMSRFDQDVLPYKLDFCLFMIGANNHDCQNPSRILAEGELQTLVDSFAARLPKRTQPIGVVLNPVVDAWHFITKSPVFREHLSPFDGSLDKSLQLERAFARDFYRKQRWPYLDLYDLMLDCPSKYVLPEDGIHLNTIGHELFGRKMFDLIKTLL